MTGFKLPKDLMYNSGLIENPAEYVKQRGSASWLFLVGDEFATMPGGIFYSQVQEAAPENSRVISDPPRTMTLDLARQHIDALDNLQRPTLISCRTGPRASAVAFMYAGLQANATPDEVIVAAEEENAPFVASAEMKDWVRSSMEALRKDKTDSA